MDTKYEYMNEESIQKELFCSICGFPFYEPCCAPCGDVFCRMCITRWITTEKASCPLDRKDLSVGDLKTAPHVLRSLVDALRVKCKVCGENGLQRDKFDEHIQRKCPKTVISCSAADIQCPWRGQRDQLNLHLRGCHFEPMRPIITRLSAENHQLKATTNQTTAQLTEQKNRVSQLLQETNQQKHQINNYETTIAQITQQINEQTVYRTRLQTENEQLKQQTVRMQTQGDICRQQNLQLNQQLRQKDGEITSTTRQLHEKLTKTDKVSNIGQCEADASEATNNRRPLQYCVSCIIISLIITIGVSYVIIGSGRVNISHITLLVLGIILLHGVLIGGAIFGICGCRNKTNDSYA